MKVQRTYNHLGNRGERYPKREAVGCPTRSVESGPVGERWSICWSVAGETEIRNGVVSRAEGK